MKRSLKLFSLLLIALVVMTGCGNKKDAKEKLDDAIDKMDDVKGLTLKMDANIEATAEGTTMAISMGMNGDFYGEDKDASGHYTTTVSLFGMSQEIEMYTEVRDGYVYTYTKSEDGWTYTKEEYKEEESAEEQMDDLFDKTATVKEEKSDKKGYTKLVVTIDKDKFNETAYGEKFKELLASDDMFTAGLMKEDVILNIYIKDGYISIIEVDLGKMLKAYMTDEETAGADMKATLTLELSNFNKVDKITVPEDVRNNATEEVEVDLDSMMME